MSNLKSGVVSKLAKKYIVLGLLVISSTNMLQAADMSSCTSCASNSNSSMQMQDEKSDCDTNCSFCKSCINWWEKVTGTIKGWFGYSDSCSCTTCPNAMKEKHHNKHDSTRDRVHKEFSNDIDRAANATADMSSATNSDTVTTTDAVQAQSNSDAVSDAKSTDILDTENM